MALLTNDQWNALMDLSPRSEGRTRDALRLVLLDGKSSTQAAALIGLDVRAVQRAVSAANGKIAASKALSRDMLNQVRWNALMQLTPRAGGDTRDAVARVLCDGWGLQRAADHYALDIRVVQRGVAAARKKIDAARRLAARTAT